MTTETPEDMRTILIGLPCPICPDNVSDEQLRQLCKDIDTELESRFGTSDTKSSDRADEAWWEALEYLAINEYNMQYYEDTK